MTCPVGLLRGSAVPETGLLPVPLTRGIQMHIRPQAGEQGAPHLHALVCMCSNVRQFAESH